MQPLANKNKTLNFLAGFLLASLTSCSASQNKVTNSTPVDSLPPPYATKSVTNFSHVMGWEDGRTPTAPNGFTVTKYADKFENPRWMYVTPNGDVLVAESNSNHTLLEKIGGSIIGASKSNNLSNSIDRITLLRDTNKITLLRQPFSLLLMPVFLLAFSQINVPFTWLDVLYPFLIIHVLVYPASNGYNSYVDRDEHSIGGLEKPPMPTKRLFYVTLAMDFTAIVVAALWVSVPFSLCLVAYILASRAYSSRQIRLKKYPITGFLLIAFFQGAFTYYMSYLGITKTFLDINNTTIWILAACSFQIAGVYPLTQIYQHQQDLADNVVTISYKLGYKGTFIFSGIMFFLCNVCYFMYFNKIDHLSQFYIIQIFFIPIVAFFVFWFSLVLKNEENANFKNTMLMNLIAAICMNTCFAIILIKNNNQ